MRSPVTNLARAACLAVACSGLFAAAQNQPPPPPTSHRAPVNHTLVADTAAVPLSSFVSELVPTNADASAALVFGFKAQPFPPTVSYVTESGAVVPARPINADSQTFWPTDLVSLSPRIMIQELELAVHNQLVGVWPEFDGSVPSAPSPMPPLTDFFFYVAPNASMLQRTRIELVDNGTYADANTPVVRLVSFAVANVTDATTTIPRFVFGPRLFTNVWRPTPESPPPPPPKPSVSFEAELPSETDVVPEGTSRWGMLSVSILNTALRRTTTGGLMNPSFAVSVCMDPVRLGTSGDVSVVTVVDPPSIQTEQRVSPLRIVTALSSSLSTGSNGPSTGPWCSPMTPNTTRSFLGSVFEGTANKVADDVRTTFTLPVEITTLPLKAFRGLVRVEVKVDQLSIPAVVSPVASFPVRTNIAAQEPLLFRPTVSSPRVDAGGRISFSVPVFTVDEDGSDWVGVVARVVRGQCRLTGVSAVEVPMPRPPAGEDMPPPMLVFAAPRRLGLPNSDWMPVLPLSSALRLVTAAQVQRFGGVVNIDCERANSAAEHNFTVGIEVAAVAFENRTWTETVTQADGSTVVVERFETSMRLSEAETVVHAMVIQSLDAPTIRLEGASEPVVYLPAPRGVSVSAALPLQLAVPEGSLSVLNHTFAVVCCRSIPAAGSSTSNPVMDIHAVPLRAVSFGVVSANGEFQPVSDLSAIPVALASSLSIRWSNYIPAFTFEVVAVSVPSSSDASFTGGVTAAVGRAEIIVKVRDDDCDEVEASAIQACGSASKRRLQTDGTSGGGSDGTSGDGSDGSSGGGSDGPQPPVPGYVAPCDAEPDCRTKAAIAAGSCDLPLRSAYFRDRLAAGEAVTAEELVAQSLPVDSCQADQVTPMERLTLCHGLTREVNAKCGTRIFGRPAPDAVAPYLDQLVHRVVPTTQTCDQACATVFLPWFERCGRNTTEFAMHTFLLSSLQAVDAFAGRCRSGFAAPARAPAAPSSVRVSSTTNDTVCFSWAWARDATDPNAAMAAAFRVRMAPYFEVSSAVMPPPQPQFFDVGDLFSETARSGCIKVRPHPDTRVFLLHVVALSSLQRVSAPSPDARFELLAASVPVPEDVEVSDISSVSAMVSWSADLPPTTPGTTGPRYRFHVAFADLTLASQNSATPLTWVTFTIVDGSTRSALLRGLVAGRSYAVRVTTELLGLTPSFSAPSERAVFSTPVPPARLNLMPMCGINGTVANCSYPLNLDRTIPCTVRTVRLCLSLPPVPSTSTPGALEFPTDGVRCFELFAERPIVAIFENLKPDAAYVVGASALCAVSGAVYGPAQNITIRTGRVAVSMPAPTPVRAFEVSDMSANVTTTVDPPRITAAIRAAASALVAAGNSTFAADADSATATAPRRVLVVFELYQPSLDSSSSSTTGMRVPIQRLPPVPVTVHFPVSESSDAALLAPVEASGAFGNLVAGRKYEVAAQVLDVATGIRSAFSAPVTAFATLARRVTVLRLSALSVVAGSNPSPSFNVGYQFVLEFSEPTNRPARISAADFSVVVATTATADTTSSTPFPLSDYGAFSTEWTSERQLTLTLRELVVELRRPVPVAGAFRLGVGSSAGIRNVDGTSFVPEMSWIVLSIVRDPVIIPSPSPSFVPVASPTLAPGTSPVVQPSSTPLPVVLPPFTPTTTGALNVSAGATDENGFVRVPANTAGFTVRSVQVRAEGSSRFLATALDATAAYGGDLLAGLPTSSSSPTGPRQLQDGSSMPSMQDMVTEGLIRASCRPNTNLSLPLAVFRLRAAARDACSGVSLQGSVRSLPMDEDAFCVPLPALAARLRGANLPVTGVAPERLQAVVEGAIRELPEFSELRELFSFAELGRFVVAPSRTVEVCQVRVTLEGGLWIPRRAALIPVPSATPTAPATRGLRSLQQQQQQQPSDSKPSVPTGGSPFTLVSVGDVAFRAETQNSPPQVRSLVEASATAQPGAVFAFDALFEAVDREQDAFSLSVTFTENAVGAFFRARAVETLVPSEVRMEVQRGSVFVPTFSAEALARAELVLPTEVTAQAAVVVVVTARDARGASNATKIVLRFGCVASEDALAAIQPRAAVLARRLDRLVVSFSASALGTNVRRSDSRNGVVCGAVFAQATVASFGDAAVCRWTGRVSATEDASMTGVAAATPFSLEVLFGRGASFDSSTTVDVLANVLTVCEGAQGQTRPFSLTPVLEGASSSDSGSSSGSSDSTTSVKPAIRFVDAPSVIRLSCGARNGNATFRTDAAGLLGRPGTYFWTLPAELAARIPTPRSTDSALMIPMDALTAGAEMKLAVTVMNALGVMSDAAVVAFQVVDTEAPVAVLSGSNELVTLVGTPVRLAVEIKGCTAPSTPPTPGTSGSPNAGVVVQWKGWKLAADSPVVAATGVGADPTDAASFGAPFEAVAAFTTPVIRFTVDDVNAKHLVCARVRTSTMDAASNTGFTCAIVRAQRPRPSLVFVANGALSFPQDRAVNTTLLATHTGWTLATTRFRCVLADGADCVNAETGDVVTPVLVRSNPIQRPATATAPSVTMTELSVALPPNMLVPGSYALVAEVGFAVAAESSDVVSISATQRLAITPAGSLALKVTGDRPAAADSTVTVRAVVLDASGREVVPSTTPLADGSIVAVDFNFTLSPELDKALAIVGADGAVTGQNVRVVGNAILLNPLRSAAWEPRVAYTVSVLVTRRVFRENRFDATGSTTSGFRVELLSSDVVRSSFTFLLPAAPFGGFCNVEPAVGFAVRDEFTVSTGQWSRSTDAADGTVAPAAFEYAFLLVSESNPALRRELRGRSPASKVTFRASERERGNATVVCVVFPARSEEGASAKATGAVEIRVIGRDVDPTANVTESGNGEEVCDPTVNAESKACLEARRTVMESVRTDVQARLEENQALGNTEGLRDTAFDLATIARETMRLAQEEAARRREEAARSNRTTDSAAAEEEVRRAREQNANTVRAVVGTADNLESGDALRLLRNIVSTTTTTTSSSSGSDGTMGSTGEDATGGASSATSADAKEEVVETLATGGVYRDMARVLLNAGTQRDGNASFAEMDAGKTKDEIESEVNSATDVAGAITQAAILDERRRWARCLAAAAGLDLEAADAMLFIEEYSRKCAASEDCLKRAKALCASDEDRAEEEAARDALNSATESTLNQVARLQNDGSLEGVRGVLGSDSQNTTETTRNGTDVDHTGAVVYGRIPTHEDADRYEARTTVNADGTVTTELVRRTTTLDVVATAESDGETASVRVAAEGVCVCVTTPCDCSDRATADVTTIVLGDDQLNSTIVKEEEEEDADADADGDFTEPTALRRALQGQASASASNGRRPRLSDARREDSPMFRATREELSSFEVLDRSDDGRTNQRRTYRTQSDGRIARADNATDRRRASQPLRMAPAVLVDFSLGGRPPTEMSFTNGAPASTSTSTGADASAEADTCAVDADGKEVPLSGDGVTVNFPISEIAEGLYPESDTTLLEGADSDRPLDARWCLAGASAREGERRNISCAFTCARQAADGTWTTDGVETIYTPVTSGRKCGSYQLACRVTRALTNSADGATGGRRRLAGSSSGASVVVTAFVTSVETPSFASETTDNAVEPDASPMPSAQPSAEPFASASPEAVVVDPSPSASASAEPVDDVLNGGGGSGGGGDDEGGLPLGAIIGIVVGAVVVAGVGSAFLYRRFNPSSSGGAKETTKVAKPGAPLQTKPAMAATKPDASGNFAAMNPALARGGGAPGLVRTPSTRTAMAPMTAGGVPLPAHSNPLARK